jgi:hypothetical protein
MTERKTDFQPRPGLIALLLFVLCLGCYLANGRTVPLPVGGDTIPNRLVPFSILGFGTLALDPFREDFAAAGGPRWYAVERGGHLVSFYPVGTPLVALPFYVPVYLYLRATGRADHASLFQYSEQAEKVAASAMAALSVALFYLTVRRRVAPRTALWSSVAFGLGTSVWATASQMLWQHGAVVLALTLALLFLTWRERPYWSAAGAGFTLALGLVTRPSVMVLYLAGLGYQILIPDSVRAKLLRVALFVAAGVPVFIFDAIYGGDFYNASLGGYTGLQLGYFVPSKFLLGLGGVLVSPNRGLFVFTPIALLGFYGLVRGSLRSRQERDPLIPLFGLAVAVHLLAVASYREWGGGWTFGPRYLVDILPVLGLAAADAWSSLPRFGKRLTAIALVWSVLVQLNGAFCYPASQWNGRAGDSIQRQAWNPFHFELWEDFRAWLALDGIAAPY